MQRPNSESTHGIQTENAEEQSPKFERKLRYCHRMKLDEIDIINRTLKCRSIEEITPEQSTICYQELTAEEEELPELSEPTSEYSRALRLYEELECLKRRIQMLQLVIKRKQDIIESRDSMYTTDETVESEKEQPKTEPCIEKVPAKSVKTGLCYTYKGSDIEVITALKKHQHYIQCEIKELIECFREARCHLGNMRKDSCRNAKTLRKMDIAVVDLMAWKELVSKEVGVCHERYKYLERVKCLAKSTLQMVKNQFKCACNRTNKLLTVVGYNFAKSELEAEIDEVVQYCSTIRDYIEDRFSATAGIVEKMLAEEITDIEFSVINVNSERSVSQIKTRILGEDGDIKSEASTYSLAQYTKVTHADQNFDLKENIITHIHPRAFWGLRNIRDIRLVGNPIKELSGETFLRSKHIEALSLSQMPLYIRRSLLKPLNVSFLNLTGIRFERIDFEAVNAIQNLKYIVFDRFYFCSMTPHVRMCKPNTDGVSSFRDLLSKPVLRYSAWIMATITISGNIMVLWGRFIYRDENIAVTMVIRNLALADILMGFYLLTIGVQDLRFRNEYYKVALDWITSWQCTVVGTLAMSSSEVSMLILAFMSLERFLLIADPFRGHRTISIRIIFLALLTIWIMGVGIAVAPIVLWHSSTRFYGTYSGTCFPLHIQEAYPLGWQYSAFVFLGLNLFLLLMIALLYTALLISIWRTRRATPLSLLDCEFAVRFFFIVLTDVLCWAPIIAGKIWVFFNYNISDDIYAWLVVFILPLNSAVNPLLYTFTTPKYRNQILMRGWKKITSRRRAEPATTTLATGTGSSNPDDSTTKAIPLAVSHNQK